MIYCFIGGNLLVNSCICVNSFLKMKVLSKSEDKNTRISIVKPKKHNGFKDKAKLRRKMLNVLNSKYVYTSDGESEEDHFTDGLNDKYNQTNGHSFDDNKISKAVIHKTHQNKRGIVNKIKKELVKNKETKQEENQMVQIISNIIYSKPKTLVNRMLDVVSTNQQSSESNKIKNKGNVETNENYLVKKTKEKIQKKNGQKIKNSLKQTSELSIFENFKKINTKKLKQNLNYKHSVMEVFDSGKLKGAIVKTANFQMNFDKNTIYNNSSAEENEDEELQTDPDNTDDELLDAEMISQDITDQSENFNNESNYAEIKQLEYKIHTFPKCCILVMKPNTTLYFCGILKATLIKGDVNVLGHKMDSLSQDIYSPPMSSLMYFESHQHSDKTKDLSKLTNYDLTENDYSEILENLNMSDSVVVLQPLINKMTKFIIKHFTDFNVFVKKLEVVEDIKAFKLLKCHFVTGNRKGVLKVSLPSTISQTILKSTEDRTSRNVTMLCGGKSSGKSTTLRYLVNQCVAKSPVLVLDLDPGQPEFTVCGLLSATVVSKPLLGPNFTHLMQPNRSITLGFISITENENRYMACVQDLCKYCLVHGNFRYMPWIINTSGLGGSIGLKLNAFIMNIVQPSLVIELMSSIKRLNFDVRLESENMNAFQKNIDFEVDGDIVEKVELYHNYVCLDSYYSQWKTSKPSLCRNIEPKDQRLLNVLAYFSQIANDDLSILEKTPYVISMADITLAFNNVCVDPKYFYSIINAKIVALCHDYNLDDIDKKTPGNINLLACYGYGIVRGIDYEEKKIYITTPVESNIVSFIDTLVYGECLPDCNFMSIESLKHGTFVPYTMSFVNTKFNKQLMKTPKRSFNPFRLLEIKNKC